MAYIERKSLYSEKLNTLSGNVIDTNPIIDVSQATVTLSSVSLYNEGTSPVTVQLYNKNADNQIYKFYDVLLEPDELLIFEYKLEGDVYEHNMAFYAFASVPDVVTLRLNGSIEYWPHTKLRPIIPDYPSPDVNAPAICYDASCALWLDPSDNSTVACDINGKIVRVNSKNESGNYAHQPVFVNQPTLVNNCYIQFTDNEFLRLDNPFISNKSTVIAVFNLLVNDFPDVPGPTTWHNDYGILTSSTDFVPNTQYGGYAMTLNKEKCLHTAYTFRSSQLVMSEPMPHRTIVYGNSTDGGSVTHYFNGALVGSIHSGAKIVRDEAEFAIGQILGQSPINGNLNLCELLIYNTYLGDTKVAEISNYLMEKWRLGQ